jgi:hypothetical protein
MRLLTLIGLTLFAVATDRPARPPLATACQTAADCGFTHYDEICCFECGVTAGSRKWVAAVEKACAGKDSRRQCRVPACGQAHVKLSCLSGQCVNR